MNRLVWTGSQPITPDQLPPARRSGGGPARILFIHGMEYGFRTTAGQLEKYCAGRPDIDAVHACLPLPVWARALGKELPKALRGWDFHNTRMTWAFGRFVGAAMRRNFPLDRFDVVHIMTRERAGFLRRPPGRRPASPKFVVNVDTTLLSWDRAYQITRTAPKVDYATDRRVLRAADAVAFATRWAMQSGIDDYGLDPARCILHMPCVPMTGLARTPGSRREGPLRIVFIGNDWERKGGPRLLAWHQERWADLFELHICSARAPAAPTAQAVVWHGAVPHDRLVRELLPDMDLCVIPTWEDTFLIAAQEAQAAGLPVVTSRLAGIPENVAHGVTGLLVDRADDAGFINAIERLLKDDALRSRMSAAAVEHVRRNLNAATWHNRLLDHLVALAGETPPAPSR